MFPFFLSRIFFDDLIHFFFLLSDGSDKLKLCSETVKIVVFPVDIEVAIAVKTVC